MKIKILLLLFIFSTLNVYSQSHRDTIVIYDTIFVKIKRPPVQTNFYDEDSATFLKDSINENIRNKKTSSLMNAIKKQANQLVRIFAIGSMASISTPIFADTNSLQQTSISIENVQKEYISSPNKIEESKSPENNETPAITNDTLVKKMIVQTQEDSVSPKYFPIYLSFFHPACIFGKQADEYTYNFALSLLTGAVGGINGLQVGGIYNQVDGPMNGVQLGGILNITKQARGVQVGGICNLTKDVNGIQVGGILNRSNKMYGVQVGGIVNASDDVIGIQVGGVVNVSKDVKGIQVSGICNVSDNVNGLQVGGVSNIAKNVTGLQISGIYNQSENFKGLQTAFVNKAKNTRGLQVGFVNIAKKLRGAQIGFINIADSIGSGVPIGFISIVKKGFYFETEALYVSNNSAKLNFRFGTSLFHTIIGGALYFPKTPKNLVGEITFGYGNNAHLVQNLYWQTSLTGSMLFADNLASKGTLSTGLVYFIGDRVGVKVIPNIFWISDFSFYNGGSNVDTYKTVIRNTHFYDSAWGSFGLGLELGISVKI